MTKFISFKIFTHFLETVPGDPSPTCILQSYFRPKAPTPNISPCGHYLEVAQILHFQTTSNANREFFRAGVI